MGNDTPTPKKGLAPKQGLAPKKSQSTLEGEKESPDSYAGESTPREAWEILAGDKESVLVDVRTMPEWTFVGVPDLSTLRKDVVLLSWRMYPQMAVNGNFCEQLSKVVIDKNVPVFFICRSGHRSMDAAIECTRYGYKYCYNITGGFEGDVDENSHRGNKNGWKISNLPWGQN